MGKRICVVLLALTLLTGLFPALAAEDLSAHPAGEALRTVAAAGILTGYEDGTMRPDNPVTVAQLATVLGRVLETNIASAPGQPWYQGAMDAATRIGYGVNAAPGNILSRKEALLSLARFFCYATGAEDNPGLEGQGLEPMERSLLAVLMNWGVFSTWDMRLEEPITRGELAIFLCRALRGVFDLETRTFAPTYLEAAKNLITDKYAGDKTLAWAESHDYPAMLKRAYVKATRTLSGTRYLLWVNKTFQRVNVFVAGENGWQLDRVFLCATGAPGTGTPSGLFRTTAKEKGWYHWDYSVYPVVRFYGGGYAFHSVLHKPRSPEIKDPTLGYPVSHGCIRLRDEDITWIYDNIPTGTAVLVH